MKNKKLILTLIVSALVCFSIAGYFFYHHINYPKLLKGLSPSQMTLFNQGNNSFRSSFRTEFSETYYIGISLPVIISNAEVDKLIKNWRAVSTNEKQRLFGPDLRWQIIDNKKIIEKWDGQKDPFRISDHFIYGEFNAKSNHEYEIEFFFGQNFNKILDFNPVIEIGLAKASVGIALEWNKGFNKIFYMFFSIMGLILVSLILIFHLKSKSRCVKTN